MKYMGSKRRIAKHILPIILKNRKENQVFYDLFVGGGNILDKVCGRRVANDNNISLQINTRGSMFGFFFCENEPKNFKEVGLCDFKRFATFHHEMLKRGFYFACSQYEAGFICTKITNEDIDACISAASEVMKNL